MIIGVVFMQYVKKENYTTEYLEQQIEAGKLDLIKDQVKCYLVATKEKWPTATKLYHSTITKDYKTLTDIKNDYIVSHSMLLENKTISELGYLMPMI